MSLDDRGVDREVRELVSQLKLGPPNPPRQIEDIGSLLGFRFPDDYSRFMTTWNGGTGRIGASYVDIYPVEVVLTVNSEPETKLNYPGLIMFGSDGGGTGYFFDNTGAVIDRPYIGGDEDAEQVAPTFVGFLRYLKEGGRLGP